MNDIIYDPYNHIVKASVEETRESFLKILDNIDTNTIPLVNNRNNIKDGTLVRYRCMISDELEQEMYLKHYKTAENITKNCIYNEVKYDNVIQQPNINDYDNRKVYIGIDIPGETAWVKDYWIDNSKLSSETSITPTITTTETNISNINPKKEIVMIWIYMMMMMIKKIMVLLH